MPLLGQGQGVAWPPSSGQGSGSAVPQAGSCPGLASLQALGSPLHQHPPPAPRGDFPSCLCGEGGAVGSGRASLFWPGGACPARVEPALPKPFLFLWLQI